MVSVFESFYVESYFYLTFLMMLVNPVKENRASSNEGKVVTENRID